MATNTVNDVMNVIASPDYGIKNIAGTNQEILAILSGTHNSNNNLHTIVNDIRFILQSLYMETTSQKKSSKFSGGSTKVSIKHIKNILDETKGIRKSIDNLSKNIGNKIGTKMPTVAKLSDKASEKVAKAMLKNMDKQKKSGEGFASLVSAFTKLKDISLKDIFFGKKKIKLISGLFKDAQKNLKIKDKDLDVIIKLINATPEMIKSLSKVGWRLNRIIKNDIIKKISDIFVGNKNSILSISNTLQKNKKVFNDVNKVAKDIEPLLKSLNKAMKKMFFASLWSKGGKSGINNIEVIINKLIPLSKKIIKNKKEINKSKKVAKNITALVGTLLTTSIVLTIAAVTAGPAILGAWLLLKMTNIVIKIAKKLSRNKRNINKAIGTSLMFVAFTGIMALSSAILATIAITGLPAILGSALMLGVIAINVFAFKMLKKAMKNIIVGAIGMAIMSGSLILFGIALDKITKATKDVTWKQFGIIAATTVLLGVVIAVLGIPAVAPFIILGAICMGVMGAALIPFGIALGKITTATKDVTWKQFGIISLITLTLGVIVAAAGLVSTLILSGSTAIGAMGIALIPFGIALGKITTATKDIKFKQILAIAGSIAVLSIAVAAAGLASPLIVSGSIVIGIMGIALIPFSKSLEKLAKTTKDISFMQNLAIAGSIAVLSIAVASAGLFSNLITLGSIAICVMGLALIPFSKSLEKMTAATKNITFMQKLAIAGSIAALSAAFAAAGLASPLIVLGSIAIGAMGLALIPFTKSLIEIPSAIKNLTFMQLIAVAGSIVILGAAVSIIGLFSPLIALGSLALVPMSDAILPFCNTLKQMSEAGDKIKLFDYGFFCMALGAISLEVAAMGPISSSIINGSEALKKMNDPLLLFSETLKKISKTGDEIGFIDHHAFCNALSDIAEEVSDVGSDLKDIEVGEKAIKIIVNSLTPILDIIKTINSFNESPKATINKVFDAIEVTRSYFSNELDDKVTKNAKKYEDIINSLVSTSKHLYTIKKYSDIPIDIVNSTLTTITIIKNFYDNNNIDDASVYKAKKYNKMIKQFKRTFKYFEKIGNVPVVAAKSVVDSMTNVINGVNTVNIDKVEAVTTMFNTFSKINKTKNIIDKFTESVKEFTSACEELMLAMGDNTDAINNIDKFGTNSPVINNSNENYIEMGYNNNVPSQQGNGIRITNVEELARTIAENINGALYVDVPDTQVQLLINGTGGNEWVISKY